MFRIDRRYVQLTGNKVSIVNTKIKSEVDASEISPDAAASENTAPEDSASHPDDDTESVSSPMLPVNEPSAPDFPSAEDELKERKKAVEQELMERAKTAERELEERAQAAERELSERAQIAARELNERAEAVMDEAVLKAEEITEKAKQDAEEARKQGYDDGYAKGIRDGERVYDTKLAEQRASDEAQLKNVLDEITAERERIHNEMEKAALSLAVEIVRKVFAPAEEELGNVFLSLLKNALKQMKSDSKFVIRVSPGEYERYFASGALELEPDSGVVVEATVLRDVTLQDGDLIIDTETETVSAGVNTQLDYAQQALIDAMINTDDIVEESL